MPGAWERYVNVLVATLHTDLVSIAWAYGLRQLQIPGTVLPLAGMPYDHARNTANQRMLEGGFTHVFHLDSDVIPPPDAIMRLINHDLPLVSGMYCRRSPPHALPVMIRKGQWVTDFVPGSMVEVELVGAGCLLLRRDFVEKFPAQRAGHRWFDWKVNYRGLLPDGECLSEDFSMCKVAREKMGVKIMVDTSIACKHVGLAEAGLGTYNPLCA